MHVPQSLHKYAYVHADPVQGVDPTGEFFGLVGAFAGFSIGRQLGARKNAADMAVADRVIYWITWNIGGSLIGSATGATVNYGLNAIYSRVYSEDREYALDANAPAAAIQPISDNNRAFIDISTDPVYRQRLVTLLETVRSSHGTTCRTNTCRRWTKATGHRIKALGSGVYDNNEYLVERIEFLATGRPFWTGHAAFRVTSKTDPTKVIYFDNGGIGDIDWRTNWPLQSGGVFDDGDIPPDYTIAETMSIDSVDGWYRDLGL